jgi:hypothetical protein
MNINNKYSQLLQPIEFVKNFSTMSSFKSWCEMGEIADLKSCLHVFVAHELYEHCQIIRDVITDKKWREPLI